MNSCQLVLLREDDGRVVFPTRCLTRLLILLSLLWCLTACSQAEMLEQVVSPQDQAAAKARIEQLRSRAFDDLEKDIDASLKDSKLRATMEVVASMVPAGEPKAITLIGAREQLGAESRFINLTFEYDFGDRWVLINVATKEARGVTTIVGLNVYPQTQPLSEQGRFELSGKSAKHYAILAGAIGAALLTLGALILCITTPTTGRRWPWVVFILCGVGKLSLNWSTGEVLFSPFHIQLFSAGAMSTLYGPWVITVALPLGAAIFLLRHASRARRKAQE